LTGLGFSVLKIKTKNVSCHGHAADSKPVKQEVNGTVVLPPLVFTGWGINILVGWDYGAATLSPFPWVMSFFA
jgi:hypothetical protein